MTLANSSQTFAIAPRLSVFAAVATLGLSACSGGGSVTAPDSDTPPVAGTDFCIQQIGTGAGSWTATFDDTCVACTVADQELAIDNNGDTHATITMGSTGTGAYSVRADAQDGVVFPAGSTAAIKVSHIRNGPTTFSQEFVTYLDGVEQERGGTPLSGGVGTMSGYHGTAQLNATQPFDGIELVTQFGSGSMETIEIFEFCGDYAE